MQNGIRPVQHSTTSTTQADEGLLRVRANRDRTEPLPAPAIAALNRLQQALRGDR